MTEITPKLLSDFSSFKIFCLRKDNFIVVLNSASDFGKSVKEYFSTGGPSLRPVYH